jgi:PAS domain S-box-containing protein
MKPHSEQLSSQFSENYSQDQLLNYVKTLEEQNRILAKENELIKQALEAAEIGIWSWDAKTNERYNSDVYLTMLGYQPGEFPMTIDTWYFLIHPDDLEWIKNISNSPLEHDMIQYQFRMRKKDGSYRWIMSRSKGFEVDETGIPGKFTGVHIDISNEKSLEIELSDTKKSLIARQEHLEKLIQRKNQNLEETQLKLQYTYQELEQQKEILTEKNNLLSEVTQILHLKQHELQTTLNRFELATKALKGGIWETKIPEDFNIQEQTPIWYSDEFITMLGYHPDNFPPVIKTWSDLIHPDFKDYVFTTYAHFIRGFAENDIYDIETYLLTQSGEYRWFRELATLVRDKNGHPVRETGMLIDIHQQKLGLEAVKQAEELFRNFIVSSPAGCAVYTIPDYEYLYINPALEELTGFDTYEINDILPSHLIHENMRQDVWQQTEESGYVCSNCSCVGKDGVIFWADVCRIKTYYRNQKAELIKFYDVTSRRKAEQALQETVEELRTTEEELRQQSEELMTVNENLQQTKLRLEEVLKNEQHINKKLEKRTDALRQQKHILRDTLNKLKKMQVQLVQSEKIAALGVLVAGVAHEINNPVNYISASSEGLSYIIDDISAVVSKCNNITPENVVSMLKDINQFKEKIQYDVLVNEARDLIDNIRTGANQTAEIVRGLRTFSRMDTDKTEDADIHTLLDSSLILLHNQYKHNVEIIKEYGILPMLNCFPGKLSQVFINLLSNAIYAVNHYTTKGHIIIRTYLEEAEQKMWAVVSIEDNGGGIPEKFQNRIFEPFFTSKEVGQGTGLGLSISLGIMESHKGKLLFETEKNKGTTFFVYVPV